MHFFSLATMNTAGALLAFILASYGIGTSLAATIEIGSSPAPGVGWIEGVCFAPIIDARVGDELVFTLSGHNVYKMPSQWEFETCEFSDATLLGEAGSGKFVYTISKEDAQQGVLYLACGVGSHCMGNQKLRIVIASDGNDLVERPAPTSTYELGLSSKECLKLQYSNGDVLSDANENFDVNSYCTDPVKQEDGGYSVTCLSPPATLTPGGVIWEARILHYPFPKDRRVRNGLRTWEFVEGDPGEDGYSGLNPVPLNQLYVHHLSGVVVFGQGGEGINQNDTDNIFPEPYGMVTGDEGDLMIFHLIDLRDVDEWLSCVECRCKDDDGNYLTFGGVNCCSNCTSTATEPTPIDYRMRYNVTYYEIEEDKPVDRVIWLTADQSPSVGKNIEYDVPQFDSLPLDQQLIRSDQKIQRLERVGPFNTIFQHGYFGDEYHGPETVKILRCTAHLHVGAIGMWLEDMVTGQTLCSNVGKHGTNPEADEGKLVEISVSDYKDPIAIPSNRAVRLVTEYDASDFHAGVMAIIFLFVDAAETITRNEAALVVDMCLHDTCDASVLPSINNLMPNNSQEDCVDELAEHPMCKFGNLCDCETVVNDPVSTGCNGIYKSTWGDLEINSVCNAYCGCPSHENKNQAAVMSKSTCQDTILEFPACKFGGICDCEVFVNMPESTGCGGVFKSSWGEENINDVCGAYCGDCPDKISTSSEQTVDMTDTIIEMIEEQVGNACKFATEECQYLLSNLYTCAEKTESSETDPVMIVVRDFGHQIAHDYSKLGEANLHVGQEDQKVVACLSMDQNKDEEITVDCEDTLAEHPSCQFGGLCDCEEFVNSPESTGCGGIYASEFGDIEVNDVCTSYCEACDDRYANDVEIVYPPGVTEAMTKDCKNTLQKSSACFWGNLCECEDFVNDPNSEGCGGIFKSRFGDVVVNEMCPSHCGACLEYSASALTTPRVSLFIATAAALIFGFVQL